MIMISNHFIFNLSIFCVIGILFSTSVRAVPIAKLAILGILFLSSFILALRAIVVAKLVNARYFFFYLHLF